MKKARKLYLCGIDWECEAFEAPEAPEFFRSVAELKRKRICWRECGIIELNVSESRWVAKQDLLRIGKKREGAAKQGKGGK